MNTFFTKHVIIYAKDTQLCSYYWELFDISSRIKQPPLGISALIKVGQLG